MTTLRQHSCFSLNHVFILFLLALVRVCLAQDATCTSPETGKQGVQGTATDPYTGKPTCLPVDRQPALYTGVFGDCLGGSEMQISRFSAAYYKDNMTVSFELEGITELDNVDIMMYITVFAYGKNYFSYIWDPCGSSSQTICPTNNTAPFYSTTVIPLGQQDVAQFPNIALQIPDFEGQAIMRIFSNTTKEEIACYSAQVTNGVSFGQPASVGTIVGLFVLLAVGASFVTTVYGTDIAEMRLHYAHSMSVWVIFAVLQHVYFSGAFSVNWPAVLPAFWSNFAWAAGMIYSPTIQDSLSRFSGNDYGNISFVGAASTGASSDGTGGGYSKSQIYKRGAEATFRPRALFKDVLRVFEERSNPGNSDLVKRGGSGNDTFDWFGRPVTPGLPLPGNYSGFAGTLSAENIPASNAFMTGFLWLIIALVVFTSAAVAFKCLLEALARLNWIKKSRLSMFRTYWLRYTGQIALRICFIAFFMIIFLAVFQFSYHGAPGPVAIASLAFVLFVVGAFAVTAWTYHQRLRYGRMVKGPDRLYFELVKSFPPFTITAESSRTNKARWTKTLFSIPWMKFEFASDDPRRADVHHDEDFIKSLGWLTARFRSNEWWFFAFWLAYDFIRACFLGGAAGHPQTQVFALLAIEFLAFFFMIKLKPFEGNRLNTLMIYLLGLSKIVTTALSSAFDPVFNLGRIITTVLGIVIIVVQAFLIIAMIILIVIGAVSSYMSVKRNRELFYPEHWRPAKDAYFRHLTGRPKKGTTLVDLKQPGSPQHGHPNELKEPYFRVDSIRRMPKIEDDEDEAANSDPYGSRISLNRNDSPIGAAPLMSGTQTRRTSRAISTHSTNSNLPFGARPIRGVSWTGRDFGSGIWSTDSSHGSGMWNATEEAVPKMPAAIRTRESSRDLANARYRNPDGYGITPARARASTTKGITPVGLKKGGNGDEYQLDVIKTRNTRAGTGGGNLKTRLPSPNLRSTLGEARMVQIQARNEAESPAARVAKDNQAPLFSTKADGKENDVPNSKITPKGNRVELGSDDETAFTDAPSRPNTAGAL